MKLSAVTYLCRDYDQAIDWFTDVLGWTLVEDTRLTSRKRWVRVAPPAGGSELLLAKADGEAQQRGVGSAAEGRVAFFLHTDDFAETEARLKAAGVLFREPAREEPYGIVAVFEDLYGNPWDLIQSR